MKSVPPAALQVVVIVGALVLLAVPEGMRLAGWRVALARYLSRAGVVVGIAALGVMWWRFVGMG